MTTKNSTGLLSTSDGTSLADAAFTRQWLEKIGFSLIQWPWLLRSLWGGSRAEKERLLDRIGLPRDALPNLGSWKADTFLLHRIVDEIEARRPAVVVELGSGATSLVIAAALRHHGGGRLHSYDQHRPFVSAMGEWLAEHGLDASFRHAPLRNRSPAWPGVWYDLDDVPDAIDLLIVDGPPWTIHPLVRGAAETLFPRLASGGAVLLDDAARPGERVVARRWKRRWRNIAFQFERGGSKGLLIGRRA
ncbi:class I SAM-dependent methyltransferase [Erythrobacteraceae bacterium CFH 75059]|uniref:class I SAM-dependent methyltransferase n=1 Tax=Qipengyuania thermophila TaxID=2509361 RepID=UPI00101F4DC4|nr:class I SAM-dependent methyltransferase [Qipengyuania thermophila]TCD04922.1 class I SAM-dependent methyltransferase [Erythrobacteraceae bacterium CFH 75059]